MAEAPKKKSTTRKTAKKTGAPAGKAAPKKAAATKSAPRKKTAAGKAAVNKKVKAITAGVKKRITPRERWDMIADAAYYLAEHRGFQGGDPGQDWIEAEHQIDDHLRREGTVVRD